MTFKKQKNLLISLFIILLTTNCSQTTNTGLAKKSTGDNPAEETSLLSKKSYQKKLTQWLRPYRIDVQQGHLMTNDMLNEIKIGMTKQQVKHILGTSLLSDSLGKNRWIYTFSDAKNGLLEKEQLVVLTFKGERLNDIKEEKVVN